MRCVVNATPRPLYARKREHVSIVQEVGWAPGPVWTGAEYLASTGIRSTEGPARSKSLYWLHYPGLPLYKLHYPGLPLYRLHYPSSQTITLGLVNKTSGPFMFFQARRTNEWRHTRVHKTIRTGRTGSRNIMAWTLTWKRHETETIQRRLKINNARTSMHFVASDGVCLYISRSLC